MQKRVKNVTAILMTLSLLFTCFIPVAYAQPIGGQDMEMKLTLGKSNAIVNGKDVALDDSRAVEPFVFNDRMMVPFRFIGENLHLTVLWDKSKQLVKLIGDKTKIELIVGENTANVNGQTVPLDSAPVIQKDRVFVPLRFIAENFSCTVCWDRWNNRVIIRQEHALNLSDTTVQKLYENIKSGDSFAAYAGDYIDVAMMDSDRINFACLGNVSREIITALSMKDGFNFSYTDEQSNKIVSDFLSSCDIDLDNEKQGDLLQLQSAFKEGENFGVTGKKYRLIGTFSKQEMDAYSKKLFGVALTPSCSHGYPVAYGSFFLFPRMNLGNVEWLSPTMLCEIFYNEKAGQYLFCKPDYIEADNVNDSEWREYSLPYRNELLRATKHNDEISLTMYHEGKYHEYSGGIDAYKGTYTNTYKQNGDDFYWISSYGADE